MHFKVGDYFTHESGNMFMLKRINCNAEGIFSFDLCFIRKWSNRINLDHINYYEDITLTYEDIFKNFEKMSRVGYGYSLGPNHIIHMGQKEFASERLFLIERESYLYS